MVHPPVARPDLPGFSAIPDPLGTSAAKLTGVYGLCQTARTLGLDYNALKRRVTSADPHGSPGQKPAGQEAAMALVELVPPEGACSPECIVELENPRGAKMRIQVTGGHSTDVVTAVSRVLFSAET